MSKSDDDVRPVAIRGEISVWLALTSRALTLRAALATRKLADELVKSSTYGTRQIRQIARQPTSAPAFLRCCRL